MLLFVFFFFFYVHFIDQSKSVQSILYLVPGQNICRKKKCYDKWDVCSKIQTITNIPVWRCQSNIYVSYFIIRWNARISIRLICWKILLCTVDRSKKLKGSFLSFVSDDKRILFYFIFIIYYNHPKCHSIFLRHIIYKSRSFTSISSFFNRIWNFQVVKIKVYFELILHDRGYSKIPY